MPENKKNEAGPAVGTGVPSRLTPGNSASPERKSIRLSIMFAGAAAGIVLFSTYGYFMLQREKADLVTAVSREMRILGESLSVAVENSVRDGQLDDVREVLDKLEVQDASVDVTVSDVAGSVLAASPGAELDDWQRAAIQSVLSHGTTVLRYQSNEDPQRAILGMPLEDDARHLVGVLTILRPLDDVQRDLRKTREGIVAAVFLFVVAMAVIGWFTGTWFVRRPLKDVRASIAKVRAGSFEDHIRIRRDDEIGALASEFNQMIDALAEARKRRDEEIQARARLERGLAEVAKLAATGQLSASLAHEIGSPLQVMAGRARSLADHPDDAVATRRSALILVEQCERVARIVEQLLHVGRRSPQKFARFDLAPVLRSVVDLLALQGQRTGVTVQFQAPDSPVVIEGNVDHVQQIVLNLVNNALAATPASGRVSVRLEETGEGARLVVTDTGAGIPEDTIDRVFEPFFTTRAHEGGTGLGLAIVRAIVEEHAGRVNIESVPGVGSTVVVEIPSRSGVGKVAEVRW